MIEIKVCLLNEINLQEYNKFINKKNIFSTFFSYEWLTCIDKTYQEYTVEVLIAYDKSKNICGVLPYVLYKKWGIVFCYSMIFYTYGGIIADNNEIFERMVCFLEEKIKSISELYTIRFMFYDVLNEELKNFMQKSDYFFKDFNAAIVMLENNFDGVIGKYKHSIRKNINKAKRENVEIREITSYQELNEFYKMATYTYNLHNSSMPYPKKIYECIYEYMVPKNLSKFHIALKDGNPIASSIHFYGNTEIFNWLTPSYREFQQYRANTLLINEIINFGCNNSFEKYNLGASPTGENGLLTFKHNWGAIDNHYYFAYKQSKLICLGENLIRFFRK